jgi:hypothetical protein
MAGVNQNRVFVVKNYVNERRVHTKQDILILRALHGILVDVGQKNDDRLALRSVSSSLSLSSSLPPPPSPSPSPFSSCHIKIKS